MARLAKVGRVLAMALQVERGSREIADSGIEELERRLFAKDQESIVDDPVRMAFGLFHPLPIDHCLVPGALLGLVRSVMPGAQHCDQTQGDHEPQEEHDVAVVANRPQLPSRDEQGVAEACR